VRFKAINARNLAATALNCKLWLFLIGAAKLTCALPSSTQ
jgi:hypothetical protein